jgi:tripartite-type tricarboxylate transporter receptor subunit TctC
MKTLLAPLFTLCAALLPALAAAQNWPAKPIRIVLPFGPGGVADITTRTLAPKLSDALGQQIVVENMPGAGGIRASETVAHATPDGYTLLLLTNGNAVSKALFKSLPYDPESDFAMISTVGFFSMVIVTRADGPMKTLGDALSYAKANPGKVNIGTITPGGTQHLAGELFRSMAGIDAVVIPHKTTGEVIISTRQGATDLGVDFIAPLMSAIKGGQLRALAVTAGKRFPGLPDVPTALEAGVKGYDVASWNALAAPAKTPPAVVDKVHAALVKALAAPDVQSRFADLGVEGRASSPKELADFYASETKRWTAVVERAKIPKQ